MAGNYYLLGVIFIETYKIDFRTKGHCPVYMTIVFAQVNPLKESGRLQGGICIFADYLS